MWWKAAQPIVKPGTGAEAEKQACRLKHAFRQTLNGVGQLFVSGQDPFARVFNEIGTPQTNAMMLEPFTFANESKRRRQRGQRNFTRAERRTFSRFDDQTYSTCYRCYLGQPVSQDVSGAQLRDAVMISAITKIRCDPTGLCQSGVNDIPARGALSIVIMNGL
mmetsp:Transcript_15164/g.62150  ORF Transcript_15164/g.62150 Transcript_15164/m.62150 type:complete len:163 (+) Transcript_15164:230-718(+)